MRSVDAARDALRTRYRRREWRWLRATLAPGAAAVGPVPDWPLRLTLGAPDERTAIDAGERFRDWQREWRAWAGPGEVRRVARRWRRLGSQDLPSHLVLGDAGAVADAIGEGPRWRRLRRRGAELAAARPGRLDAIGALLPLLDALDDADWTRWRAAADWLAAHPASGLYPRQLPVAGVDTKTLERWRGSLERWVVDARATAPGPGGASPAEVREAPGTGSPGIDANALIGTDAPDADALDPLGLRRPPARVRVRALDPALPGWPAGLGDVELPVVELAALAPRPARVIVVENLQSGLALPPLPGALAIVGLGYALEPLSALPWLRGAPIDYWGDVDTHGLAMLGRVRARFARVRSMLMDEATLLAHRELWVEEPSPHGADGIAGLTEAEAALYADLKRGRWGVRVRLEQERIAWPAVLAALDPASR